MYSSAGVNVRGPGVLVLPYVVVVLVGTPNPGDDPKDGVVLPKNPVVVVVGVDSNKLGAGGGVSNKPPPVVVGAEDSDPNKPDAGALLPPKYVVVVVVVVRAVPNNPVDGACAPNEEVDGAGAVDPKGNPVFARRGDPNPKELAVVEVGALEVALPNSEDEVPNPVLDPKADNGALPNKGAEVLVPPNKPDDGAEVLAIVANVDVVQNAVELPPKVLVLEGVAVVAVAEPLFPTM